MMPYLNDSRLYFLIFENCLTTKKLFNQKWKPHLFRVPSLFINLHHSLFIYRYHFFVPRYFNIMLSLPRDIIFMIIRHNITISAHFDTICHTLLSVSVAQWLLVWSANRQVLSLNTTGTFIFLSSAWLKFKKLIFSPQNWNFFGPFQIENMLNIHIFE